MGRGSNYVEVSTLGVCFSMYQSMDNSVFNNIMFNQAVLGTRFVMTNPQL